MKNLRRVLVLLAVLALPLIAGSCAGHEMLRPGDYRERHEAIFPLGRSAPPEAEIGR